MNVCATLCMGTIDCAGSCSLHGLAIDALPVQRTVSWHGLPAKKKILPAVTVAAAWRSVLSHSALLQNMQPTEEGGATLTLASERCRIVLDVRNNGGGFFPAGVDVARMLLSGGDIVLIADSQGVRDSYEADGTAVDAKSQLAVLVNRGTASASEVCPCDFLDVEEALRGHDGRSSRTGVLCPKPCGDRGLLQKIVEHAPPVFLAGARHRAGSLEYLLQFIAHLLADSLNIA